MKRYFVGIVLLLLTSLSFAQDRYGHINFGNLISLMPETAKANTDLEAYQKELVAKGETMATKLQEDYGAYIKSVQSGDMTPKQQQEAQDKLRAQQQAIADYEQEITQQIAAKRDELLSPLVERAQNAVKEVAKENGFKMIFDTSLFNAILFAAEAEDIMPMVKTKLGIAEN